MLKTVRAGMCLVATLGALCVVGPIGCGKHEYRRRSYVGESLATPGGDDHAYLALTPTRAVDSGLWHRTDEIGAPFTLELIVTTREAYAGAVKLHSASMERDGRSTSLQDAASPPLQAPLARAPGTQGYRAKLSIPLGDVLSFAPEARVGFTVQATVPYAESRIAVERTFRADQEDHTGSLADLYLSR